MKPISTRFSMLAKAFSMLVATIILFGLSESACADSATIVPTYHMDNWRTGWNHTESILTQTSVASSQFGVIASVPVDGGINEQPLDIPNQPINCLPDQTIVACTSAANGTYEVLYVVTENDSIYALDATTGAVLLKRNFLPVGSTGAIQSTPVIDVYRKTLYFVDYSLVNFITTLKLHAIKLEDLSDATPAYNITGSAISATLSDGTTYAFNQNLVRVKAALLLANNGVYVGTRAQGEVQSAVWGLSRGWMLKFSVATLRPMESMLVDSRATSAMNYFISSVWMSKAGPAADDVPGNSNIYFVTGNSDKTGTSYDPVYNLEESTVERAQNLAPVSSFTPANYGALDKRDGDFGAGGVLKVPTNYLYDASMPSLVAAAGKEGRLYLMNAANLGGYTPGGPDKVLDEEEIGQCWCAPSFFTGANGIGRIVTSGGNSIMVWAITKTSTSVKLVELGSAQIATSNGVNFDPGFFTSISSNGTRPTSENVIIWAVSRPVPGSNVVNLYAFSPKVTKGTLTQIGMFPAGVWNQAGNSDIVPVVANGKVFVGSDGVLTIFGLSAPK